MKFKSWLLLSEALDANTKNLLAKAKAPKDQLDAFIKELEDEPTLIDKPTAFQRFQDKFLTKKEKPKDEDAQRKYFSTIPNTTEEELQTYDYYKNESPQSLRQMMELLRKFIEKKIITIKIENKVPNLYRNTLQGSQKIETPDFGRFTSQLDSIQGEITKYKSKGNYFNPIEEELNHQQNLVAKGDNVWVFKGHAPDVCRIYGKGHPWCISSSTSAAHWFTYRIRYHQTQYFVFDFNKDEDDPARYVNPGVAPEGMYSEWVDARNKHGTDPEDSESEVGINGYKSINEYKKYLASKGIPESTWKTTKPEDWEKRLHLYDKDRYFASAKNDEHPEVFPMYLKIVNRIKDSDFDTLTDDQKKEFFLSKSIDYLTEKQLEYILKNAKSEYYNSLDLYGKIKFAITINDQNLLFKLAENPKIDDKNIYDLLKHATDKDKFAEIIINKKPELSDNNVDNLLQYATDKEVDKIAELIIEKQPELSDYNVRHLLHYANDKDKFAEIIINKKPELSYNNVDNLLHYAKDKDKIAEIILNKKLKLSDDNVYNLFRYATDKDKMAESILNKKPELSDNNVDNLLKYAIDKDKFAKIILNKKTELSDKNVDNLLKYATDKDKFAEIIINKKTELSDYDFINLLFYAKDQNKITTLLGKEKIAQLFANDSEVIEHLLEDAKYSSQEHMHKIVEVYARYKSELTDHDVHTLLTYGGYKIKKSIMERRPDLSDDYLHDELNDIQSP